MRKKVRKNVIHGNRFFAMKGYYQNVFSVKEISHKSLKEDYNRTHDLKILVIVGYNSKPTGVGYLV